LAIHIEYNIIGGENSDYGSPHKLYAFVGVGAMISDVKFTNNKDNTRRRGDSHPVSDEELIDNSGMPGYNFKTVVVTPTFPIGGGYEYNLTPSIAIGAEYVIHASFSDYLDGVTTSDSKNKDYLMNLDLTFTYKFGKTGGQNRRRVNWN
jgi:opacity protein-like surface antigen